MKKMRDEHRKKTRTMDLIHLKLNILHTNKYKIFSSSFIIQVLPDFSNNAN